MRKRQRPPSSSEDVVSGRAALRFALPIVALVVLNIAAWFGGWIAYSRFSLWQMFTNLDFQNLLLLLMAALSLIILALTKTGDVKRLSIVRLLGMTFCLDVAVWSLGWLQYSHSDYVSGLGTLYFEVGLGLAMALASVAFLVLSQWTNTDDEPSRDSEES